MAPDALKFAPDASSTHRSYTQKGLQMRGVTGPTPSDALLSVRSLTQRALKNARTPDAHHQTHLEHPVLSVRDSRRSQAAPDAPTGFNLRPVLSVRGLTLTGLGTDSTLDA